MVGLNLAIPVLNEETTLKLQLEKILAFMNESPEVFKDTIVTIADNGSTDKTQEIGRMLALTKARVRYVRLREPGVGKALR